MTLYDRRHLHGDPGSVVEVFQHVLALGVFEQRTGVVLQGGSTGPAVRVVMKGSFSPACGDETRRYHSLKKVAPDAEDSGMACRRKRHRDRGVSTPIHWIRYAPSAGRTCINNQIREKASQLLRVCARACEGARARVGVRYKVRTTGHFWKMRTFGPRTLKGASRGSRRPAVHPQAHGDV